MKDLKECMTEESSLLTMCLSEREKEREIKRDRCNNGKTFYTS